MLLAKSIFWFEDNSDELQDYHRALQKKYEMESGAHWDLIKRSRSYPIALVIVDLMIHDLSLDEETGEEIQNIEFPNTAWIETGLEFLRRLRAGEYQSYGFSCDVPVIVATAVVSYPAQDQAKDLNVAAFLEKPFTIQALETTVNQILDPSKEQA